MARDPNYFLAYCKLASVHDQIYLNGPDHTPARLALADAALKVASACGRRPAKRILHSRSISTAAYLDFDRARRGAGNGPSDPCLTIPGF